MEEAILIMHHGVLIWLPFAVRIGLERADAYLLSRQREFFACILNELDTKR